MSKKNVRKLLGFFWFCLLVSFFVFIWFSDIQLKNSPNLIKDWVDGFQRPLNYLLFLFIYLIRPFLLFPSMFVAIAAGLCFGPWIGGLITMVGENVNAYISFAMGRFFSSGVWTPYESENKTIREWDRKLKENGFMAVLVMRLLFLPFDPLSYSLGMTSVHRRDYILATFFGILPGLVSLVMIGGAWNIKGNNQWVVLYTGLAVFGVGLLAAKFLNSHKKS